MVMRVGSLPVCALSSMSVYGAARWRPAAGRASARASDVEVFDVEGILLDELAARLHGIPHKNGEDLVRLDGVGDVDLEKAAGLGVHRGLPELRRVHLAQPLVALDRDP